MSEQWNIVNVNEVHKFTNELNLYRQGEVSDGDFLPQRLANGIYGQRQDDAYMVRIKLPAGELSINQLLCIGDLISRYSDIEFASVTTRQDIQLHFVPLKNIPKVLLRLADVGLTTREACGNTVRNITACPLAGQCDKEQFDVRPLLNETVQRFMGHPLTKFMPRKVKMSFSGCETDCAMGMIHDVGVVAVKRGDAVGFKVLVGGGLGHKPRQAIVVEEFIEKEKVALAIETIITLHNRHSDRKKRAKSRIKFLIEKFGEDGFVEKYKEALLEVSKKVQNISKFDSKAASFCEIDSSRLLRSNAKKYQPLEVNLNIGDISVSQIKALAKIMKAHDLSRLRATQTQNLLITDVLADKFLNVKSVLSEYGFSSDGFSLERKSDIVSCPGEWTCRLGITSSRRLGQKLIDNGVNLKIHVSGCHNGCAQPQLSDIGLHGEARRKFGKLIPYYQTYFGGDGKQGGGFGFRGPEVPASRIEFAIKIVQRNFEEDHAEDELFSDWAQRKGAKYFSELLADITQVTAEDLPWLLKDVDSESEFKVLQLGGGECAGISEETVAARLAEATYEKEYRDLFVRQSKLEPAAECAENMLRLVGKSILFQQGISVGEDVSEISCKLSDELSRYPAVGKTFGQLLSDVSRLRYSDDNEAFLDFSGRLDTWVDSLSANNNKISLDQYLVEEDNSSDENLLDAIVDLSSETCPMHYIKARQALRNIGNGQVLKIRLSKGEDERLVTGSLKSVGFNIVKTEPESENNVLIYVEKPALSPSEDGENNNGNSCAEVA